nr:cytochrome f, chloroplastic [Tanacetum cinerariifolium]
LGIHGLGLVIVAIEKKLVVVLVGVVETGYENPREATRRIVCANCHLANKPVDIEVPQAAETEEGAKFILTGARVTIQFRMLQHQCLSSCGYFLECNIDARDSDGHLRSCLTGLGRVGRFRKSRGNGRVASTRRIWVAIWNVKSMAGKLFELADVSGRHKVDIACFQETK